MVEAGVSEVEVAHDQDVRVVLDNGEEQMGLVVLLIEETGAVEGDEDHGGKVWKSEGDG